MKFGFVDEHRHLLAGQSDVQGVGSVGQRLRRLALAARKPACRRQSGVARGHQETCSSG